MAKRKWTLPHQIAYLYFTIGIMGQGQQDARDKRLPVIAKKFSEWPFEGEDNKKILEEAVQSALSDMEDSMEPVVQRLESCVTNLKENLSKDNLGAIIDDLFHIVNSASPTEAEIGQIKAIAKHFEIEPRKPEKLKKESERTSEKKRTLLHEMAYVYFDLVTQNQEQSSEDIEAKLDAVRTKLAEWTEDKKNLPELLHDTFAEICDDKSEKIEEYVDRIGKCHALMKEHIPGDQLVFVIDDLIDVINTGTPHEAEIRMIRSLAEYFGVSLEGEKYQILNRPYQTTKSESESSESSDDAELTLIHEIAFCYVASAIYEGVGDGVDESGVQKRLNRVLEKLAGWSADFAEQDMDFQDLIQETITKIDSEDKSEDLIDLYWQSLERIKDQVPAEQLPRIIQDLKYILVDARSRELDALKKTAEFLDTPLENPEFKNQLSKFMAGWDERQSRTSGDLDWSGLYEVNAVPCRDNMLSFIFHPDRLQAMGLLEIVETDVANTLNEQIIEAATERIKETGMIPVLLLGGEDEYEEEIVLRSSGKGNKKVPIKDIYESLDYPLKRAPFFFANDFIINSYFETPVVFTQDGIIAMHPEKSGKWMLTAWDRWSGSQLVTVDGSREPSIRIWDESDAITIGSYLDKKGNPSNGASVVVFMQAIVEAFWPVVEENRDSKVMSMPMDKFDLLNEASLKKYVMNVLIRAGLLSGSSGGEGVDEDDDVDAPPGKEELEQELQSAEGHTEYSDIAHRIARDLGDMKWAREIFTQALEVAEGAIQLSWVADYIAKQDGLNDSKWATKVFKKALEVEESAGQLRAWTLSNVARFIAKQDGLNDAKWAKTVYQTAVEKAKNVDDSSLVASRIAEQDGLNDAKWAREAFNKTLEEAEGVKELSTLASRIAEQDGLNDPKWARKVLEKALEEAEGVEELSTVASSISYRGGLNDADWARGVFHMAIDAAVDADDYEYIACEVEISLNDSEWAEQIRQMASDTADKIDDSEDEYNKDDQESKPSAGKLPPPILMTKEKEQYRAKVREALADGKLSDLERSGLDFFQQKLRLSDADAMRIFEEVLGELQGKPGGEISEKKKRGRPKKVADASESAVDDADDEGGARKKRITYNSWDEFENEQPGKDELKKRWMPIAKRTHEFIQGVLQENDLEYEIRYGDGTFSFYIPKEKAQSRQRKFARFGLVSFTRRHSYLDGLYVKDVKDVPSDAHCDTPNDDLPTYSHRFVTMDDFEQAKDIIRTGVLRSYGLLAKVQTTARVGKKPVNTPENKSPDTQRKASNLGAQATLLANQGNWDEAESLFSEAIELDPAYALAYKYRGMARWNQNETSGALADCNKYLELRPKDAEAYRMRGRIKGKMGEHAEAIEDFSKAIEHGENDDNLSISYYLRGYAQTAQKKFKNAIRDFDQAIKLNPDYEYAFYMRGMCKTHLEDNAGAVADLKKSASLGCDEAKEMLAKLQ